MILLVRFFNLNYDADPKSIGMNSNQFIECPSSPNCISTMTSQKEKLIDAISYSEDFNFVRDRLTILFHQLNNAKLIEYDSTYFHLEFRTFPLAFTDDVEVFIDRQAKLIHFKSASRLGHYDFGTNRRRLEKIRSLYLSIE